MKSGKTVTGGVVLRVTDTKETDRILTVLTADRGKIPLIARGARRKNSRLAAACQMPAYSELTIFKRGSWYMLDEASPIELFDGLGRDIELLALAATRGMHVHYGYPVETLSAEGDGWLLNQQRYHQAVVLANGHRITGFGQTAQLPVYPVGGQVSHIPTTPRLAALRQVLCYDGYIDTDAGRKDAIIAEGGTADGGS